MRWQGREKRFYKVDYGPIVESIEPVTREKANPQSGNMLKVGLCLGRRGVYCVLTEIAMPSYGMWGR